MPGPPPHERLVSSVRPCLLILWGHPAVVSMAFASLLVVFSSQNRLNCLGLVVGGCVGPTKQLKRVRRLSVALVSLLPISLLAHTTSIPTGWRGWDSLRMGTMNKSDPWQYSSWCHQLQLGPIPSTQPGSAHADSVCKASGHPGEARCCRPFVGMLRGAGAAPSLVELTWPWCNGSPVALSLMTKAVNQETVRALGLHCTTQKGPQMKLMMPQGRQGLLICLVEALT